MREQTLKGQYVLVVSDSEKRRCDECPHRAPGRCALISNDLGFNTHLPLADCNECWSLGGEVGGASWRSSKVSSLIAHMKEPGNFHRLPRPAAEAFAKKHLSEDEASSLLTTHTAPSPAEWLRVKPTWEQATSLAKSVRSRGLFSKRVPLTIKNERHISCFGSDLEGLRVADPCPALATSADGLHHYCNDCGCGDKEVARLDGTDYDKLDYPYLACPRKRKGFSDAVLPHTLFDRAFCITLKRRPDRWARFSAQVGAIEWPLPPVEKFEAVDGSTVPGPDGWGLGGGTWGCLRSHQRVLEMALSDRNSSVLVFEDDAVFMPEFADRLRVFLAEAPPDWEGLMLGGQHIGLPEVEPIKVKPGVVRCVNCQRTHAYAVRGDLLKALYKAWSSWRPGQKGHADHIMGPLCAGFRVYAPDPFLVAQAAGKSDINGKDHPRKFWDLPSESAPIIFFRTGKRPDPVRLREHGYHMGYDVDAKTGIDKGVLGIAGMPTRFDRLRGWSSWFRMLEMEAATIGAVVAVWAPYDGAEGEVREAAGDRFKLVEEN